MGFNSLAAVIVGTRKGYVLPRETEEQDGMVLIQFTEGEVLISVELVGYDPDNTDGFFG